MNLIKNSVVSSTFFSLVLSTQVMALNTDHNVVTENTTSIVSVKDNSAKAELMSKLASIKFFTAEFTQKIFDEAGNELQQGSGLLSVSKPNLVNWQTITPDESLIVSDGSNLWFYDPFVEQVSVYSLASAIANTPILLITSNDETLWQDYTVSRISSVRFLITAKSENARVKSLTLTFDSAANSNQLAGFEILDATGQLSVISLLNNPKVPDASLFEFIVPEGVHLDDQR